MGLFNLLTNTVEGVAQTALGATKAAVGTVSAPLDDGKTLDGGLDNMREGVDKIGSANLKGETDE